MHERPAAACVCADAERAGPAVRPGPDGPLLRVPEPKKSGAMSEMQPAVQADAEKEQQPRQAHADATNVQCMFRERKID